MKSRDKENKSIPVLREFLDNIIMNKIVTGMLIKKLNIERNYLLDSISIG